MNLKSLLKALAAAALGGAATGATQALSTTGTINKGTGQAALAGAIVAVAAYFKTPPAKPEKIDQ